ncbi:PREDICTED: early placenta insulin-like peptide [Chinchilla lanigera]|uniref:early placenta insulin-like peptide n=1 Tax=Chinchilla lanigera TaxID=34839 RepID=UPI00038EDCDC|nr:PREDICTED: early placenta insulin-like peptide [Chinchilla lanigera]
MTCMFVTYLLGIWLLLSQLPGETTAGLVDKLRYLICNNPLVDRLERRCMRIQAVDPTPVDGLAVQPRGLSEFPGLFTHRDSEALNILVKFIPEPPQELKAMFSDEQSLLRTLNHPKDRAMLFTVFVRLCCKFNCVQQTKMLICNY